MDSNANLTINKKRTYNNRFKSIRKDNFDVGDCTNDSRNFKACDQ